VISISTIRSLAVGLAMFALGACAPVPATSTYAPSVGQPGKDVVWVPTPSVLVDTMLDMAKVTPDDFVIDLGSGDGRTVIAAAMRGARALGIEYEGEMVALSRRNAQQARVADRATFVQQDLFESDFSKATVVTMFLLPDINRKLMPKLLSLKPGTRIVSNSFTMDTWQADETATVGGDCTSWCTAYLWIVPAKAAGAWQLGASTLTLTQEFQVLGGTMGTTPISAGRLNGEDITFAANGVTYTGKVNGNSMKGTTSAGASWSATKK
jgi:hypothetical protein